MPIEIRSRRLYLFPFQILKDLVLLTARMDFFNIHLILLDYRVNSRYSLQQRELRRLGLFFSSFGETGKS